jgi:FkbM family methyltransferase
VLTTRHKIALARMAQAPILGLRQLVGLGPELKARRKGLNWALDLREGIDFSIFLLGAFEPSTVTEYEKHVKPGMTVLDIGANVGAHTIHLARIVGDDGRVMAFEPTDWAVAKLKANMAENPALASRISVSQVLLSDEEDATMPDSVHASWPLAAGGDVHPLLRARGMSVDGARAARLDTVLQQSGCDRVDFIKMDVDGHECQVLGGMTATLEKDAPPILMEFSPYGLAEKGGSLEQMMGYLHGAGYDLYPLGSTVPLSRNIAELRDLTKDGAGFNVIAKVG